MNSWTRTLNLDDAHTLLALAAVGTQRRAWTEACHAALPDLSMERRRELVRLLRDGFLEWDKKRRIAAGVWLRAYEMAPALGQIDLVAARWALSHPITLIATDALIGPALASGAPDIPLDEVQRLVARHVTSSSAESLRKTRTTLLGALEQVGALHTRGTGQHRSLTATRGQPHATAFAWLIAADLEARGANAMMAREAVESALPTRLTRCTAEYAEACVATSVRAGMLDRTDDEVRVGPALR